MKYTFCNNCGIKYDNVSTWPRHCEKCGAMEWLNAKPVAILVQPVRAPTLYAPSLLLGRRGMGDGKGKLALISGFIEIEPWQNALAREAKEEINLDIAPNDIKLFDTLSTLPTGQFILIFGLAPIRSKTEILEKFKPNKEITELVFMRGHEFESLTNDIAFPLHLKVIKQFFFNS